MGSFISARRTRATILIWRWASAMARDNGAKIINMSIGRSGAAGSAPVVESAMALPRLVKASSSRWRPATGSKTANPVEVIAGDRARQARKSVAAVDPSKAHRTIRLRAATSNCRHPADPSAASTAMGLWQQTFDYRFTETYLYPPSRTSAPRFDVLSRVVGWRHRDVDTPHVSGVAAMLMQQGHHQSRCDRGRHSRRARPIWAHPAGTTCLGSGSSRRMRRCGDWVSRGEDRCAPAVRVFARHAFGAEDRRSRFVRSSLPNSRSQQSIPSMPYSVAATARSVRGGGQVVIRDRFVVEVGASHYQEDGQRAL